MSDCICGHSIIWHEGRNGNLGADCQLCNCDGYQEKPMNKVTDDRIRDLTAQPAAIPTRERLPQVGERVLVWIEALVKPWWTIAILNQHEDDSLYWITLNGNDYDLSDVSHWLPLPPAPTSETP